MTTRLLLYGPPQIEHGGIASPLPCERRTQLVVFLALKRAWIARAELAALFWPEQPAKLAYANLRKTLFRVQALPWAPAIQSQGNVLRCEAETDVHDFEAALRDGRTPDALALRRGELLPGFDDDASDAWTSWIAFERDRLRGAWRTAALARLTGDLAPDEGVALSAQLLDVDPLDEAALREHMAWLARSGQAARARHAYHEYAQRLSRDLGLTPGAALASLHATLGAPAPATSLPAPPSLAASGDGFVGRATELRRLTTLLARDDCRLVSITGPGGVGKTRLVRRALEVLAANFPDGVAFIALEDAASANDFATCLAHGIAAPPAGQSEPFAHAVGFLRDRRMLLALDNFEQLVADGGLVTRLLAECPQLRLVVTSRVRLAVAGEWLFPLTGLPCPEPEDHEHVDAFDAARLFVQAAHRVAPALAPAREAAAIVEICRQVEGLPLALELAAAWTRVLSCDEIAAELGRGTELLRTEEGALPSRHASIEVVFEQSWQLLTARERDALARLTVCRGGFSAEAARAVGDAALPVLGALADKSLLHKEDTRLRMHPLVQQLAALRLPEAARAEAERAHAKHFHRVLVQLHRAVVDGEREALAAVDADFDNCRLAWRWAVAHGEGAMLRAIAKTLMPFCEHRGRYAEGLDLLREAPAAEPLRDGRSLGLVLLVSTAQLEYRLDRYAEAEATALRAMAMARTVRDTESKRKAVNILGACCMRRGRHDEARRHFTQALVLAPEDVDPRGAAAALDHLALVEKGAGRYDEAMRLSLRSLVLHRRVANVGGEALCLANLGSLCSDHNDLDSAALHLRDALAVCERHGLTSTRSQVLGNLAGLATRMGHYAEGEGYARRAIEIVQATGNRLLQAWLTLQLAQLALKQDDLAATREHLSAGLTIALALGAPALLLGGAEVFADLMVAERDIACARAVLAFAAGHAQARVIEREYFGARLAELPDAPTPAWPGMTLDELAHRLVVERDVAYAPLRAALRASP